MDSPGNFCMYDSEYFTGKELNKPDEVFLFGNEDDSMNFGGLADYTGLFQNENSIDLNAYINPSTSPTNGFIQLSELLPSSPPKSGIPTELPPLIRPEEAEATQSTSRHIPQHTSSPSVTVANLPDSMPSSHPQFMSHHQDCQEGAAALQVKVEPSEQVEPAAEYYTHEEYEDEDDDDDDASTYTSGPSRPASPLTQSAQRGRKSSTSSKSNSTKRVRFIPDKDSEEYRQKRFKNNIAVRRSREKSKAKSVELQSKVKELTTENDRLNKRVELLTKELTVLKSLFTNVGKSAPPSLANM